MNSDAYKKNIETQKPAEEDNLTVSPSRVREAAAKCPLAQETLKTLFPEAFPPVFKHGDIVVSAHLPGVKLLVLFTDSPVNNALSNAYGKVPNTHLRLTDGRDTYTYNVKTLTKVGSL